MTILSSNSTSSNPTAIASIINQLPPLKLPSLFLKKKKVNLGEDQWSTNTISTNHMLFQEEYHRPMAFNSDNLHQFDYYYSNKMSTTTTSTDILLPPILTSQLTTTTQLLSSSAVVPLSPPYSTCSSALSVSSFPSSPSSSSSNSFSSYSSSTSTSTTTAKKKGSIQSLLNSGSELLELEKKQHEQQQQQSYYFEEDHKKNKKKRPLNQDTSASYNSKKQKTVGHINNNQRQIKGLRLFSKQVCDKVAEKKTTTYNEVADELAADIQRNNQNGNMAGIDQKNIRRRVYDALNVLMALNLITKDRKEIKWLGLEHERDSEESTLLEQEIKNEESRQKSLMESIKSDQTMCNDAWVNLNRLKQLVQRNQQQHHQYQQTNSKKIQLPFFLIQGQDIETCCYHSNNEACLTTSSSTLNVYKDVDILAKIWPASSSFTTIVS